MSDFTSIYISGNLISYDLLERFDRDLDHVGGQKPNNFGFDSSANMRQEIGRAWEDASRQWTIFKSRKERLKDSDKGTTETRTHWMIPFCNILGYNLEFQKDETIGEKNYKINHRDITRDLFPVLIVTFKDKLDKKPDDNSLKTSPHAHLQDYLNNTDHTFGLVTNGFQLRLLRDTGRISKPVYAEFNLEKIFDESLYAEFVLLYRLLHVSRMPLRKEQVAESFIEQYHQDAIESGGRIREQLSTAMEHAIKMLGKGLLHHPMNIELRKQISEGNLSEAKYYNILLRLIYRILFLMTIEERKLVYPEKIDEATNRFAKIYNIAYSIERLRKLAANRHRVEGKQHDLWVRLIQTLRLFEKEDLAQKLGLHALGTGLFEIGAISPFDECKVNNEVLMEAVFALSYFENENKTMQRINYRQLDVEEFGSVYQGLLDYKISFTKAAPADAHRWDMALQSSKERSKSGTHYTPEELVQPLIKHSLDYLIADRKKIIEEQIKNKNLKGNANHEAREQIVNQYLLSLKICDVACGSGHILISAGRRIAEVAASVIQEEEQPNPTALRKAKREVIRQCIYGVDMNPMAVELCKVALWLEAHNPCEPLNFLDHHIKCGDAIVGLAHKKELENGIPTEAFQALPGDNKNIASAFAKKNKQELNQKDQAKLEFEENYDLLYDSITAAFDLWKRLPERTPDEIHGKQKQYEKLTSGAQNWKMRTLADMQVAQFFIPKIDSAKDLLVTDAEYRKHLKTKTAIQTQAAAKATAVASAKKFFHWFLEFPEVFKEDGGFDCILGNPPFLGGKKISTHFGDSYISWIKHCFPEKGSSDLVGYFFRRIFSLVKQGGFQSLIATNSIAQGDTRTVALEKIIGLGGTINFAIKTIKWPGLAAVEVSLIGFFKGNWSKAILLDNKNVSQVSSYLDDSESLGNPFSLYQNSNKSFQGTIVLGKGFILEREEAEKLLFTNKNNETCIHPFLTGDDINGNPEQNPSRYIINFRDWEIEYCKKNFPECFEILVIRVKPQRDELIAKGKQIHEYNFWKFWDRRPYLYEALKNLNRVLVINNHTKYCVFTFSNPDIVFSHATTVICFDDIKYFALLNSTIHNDWAWKNGSTMGSNTLRYIPSECFQTFPFPKNLSTAIEKELEQIGEQYHEHRKQLMLQMQLGLTKTYNLFHSKALVQISNGVEDLYAFIKHIEKQQGKDASGLLKHLQKTFPNENVGQIISLFNSAVEGIFKLRSLHKQMDVAALAAYGWNDVALQHNFYEVDYLPENDRTRYTIHPDSRKEILKRLLELNHKIHEEETKSGVLEKKKEKKEKKSRKITGADLLDLEF